MSNSFLLPDLGEGVHEAEILQVVVSVGQAVTEGDVIFEIETDKAAVEIPSPYSGIVEEIRVKTGDMATVGDILITFADQSSTDRSSLPRPTAEKTPPAPPADAKKTGEKSAVIPAAPSTRRLARELGINLQDVVPTGAAGVVTKDDVETYAKSSSEPQANVDSVSSSKDPEETATKSREKEIHTNVAERLGETEKIPFRSIRRATATRMAQSWSEIPHVHCQDDIDVTELEAFRKRHKKEIETAGGRLTLTIFAIKALATALKNYPYFNSSLDLENQQIILKHYFNIGIAVDTPNGLMVPVIKDVDRKSIKELSIEVSDSIAKVRSGKHTREQMHGGTFTITNAGALGGNRFSAIINHPEVAILGLGQSRMQPAVVTDERGRHEIRPRLIMPIMLCFDHRVVDGADAIRFLKVIIDALEDPDELLITMI